MQTPSTRPVTAGFKAGSFSRVDSLFDELRQAELPTPKPPRRASPQKSKGHAESSSKQISHQIQQHRRPPSGPSESDIRKHRTELLAIKRSIGLALETLPAAMQNTRKSLTSNLSWVKTRLHIMEGALQRCSSLDGGIVLPPIDSHITHPYSTEDCAGLACALRQESGRVHLKDLSTLKKLDAQLTQAIPIAKRIESSLSDRFKLPPLKP